MKKKNEKGFSLVELLIVVVIIGVIAAIAVPAFQRGITAAENRSIFATMRVMASTQATFFSQKQRFARLAELNTMQGGGLGTVVGDQMFRHKFVFEMPPGVTDAELRDEYSITASRDAGGILYVFVLTQDGRIVRTSPGPDPDSQ